jgi:hypothetical protein
MSPGPRPDVRFGEAELAGGENEALLLRFHELVQGALA